MSGSGGAAVVAMTRRAERIVVDALRTENAISAGRATPLSVARPGARAALRRLMRRGAVHETEDRYWLDEAAYESMRDGRRVRAVIGLTAVAIFLIALLVVGAFRA